MLINTEEYFNHLQESLPEFQFTELFKKEDYKDGEVYEIAFKKDDKEFRYNMLAGVLDFTEEQFKENFVTVARNTYKAKTKEEGKEKKEQEKNKE